MRTATDGMALRRSFEEIGVGLHRLSLGVVNVYALCDPEGGWVLVDAGFTTDFDDIATAAARAFEGRSPDAIVLTHGHFDHAGAAGALAASWSVPVYVHDLERPFVTARSDYPPPDPTVGGALALMTRFHRGPTTAEVVGAVRSLPGDGTVPGAPGWTWLHTPGHTPGHVSLWRVADRTLLAGDACTTVDSDSILWLALRRRRVCRPGTPTTYDWTAAERSVSALAALNPLSLACGHGEPMHAPRAGEGLVALAACFPVPRGGRYAIEPARFTEDGTASVPPPVADRWPARVVSAAVALAVGGALASREINRRRT